MRLVTALATLWLVVACSSGGSATGAPTAAASPGTAQQSAGADQPPLGWLRSRGTEVVGFLGTYCWQGLCADVFDTPPPAELPFLAADAQDLRFSLTGGAPFMSWSASYRADGDEVVTPLAQGGTDFDPDTNATAPPSLTMADFAAPPTGDWVVVVQAFFEGGDAQYMWHVVVE